MVTIRVRSIVWFATGAVMSLVVSLMVLQAWSVDAAPGDTDTTFVPMTQCRLIDTRPAPLRIGPHGTWSAADTGTVQATGTNGDCTLPADAVALLLNVTALNASADGFLTFWAGGPRPLAASLNPSPGQPPVPNAVTVELSGAGSFDLYNENGTVDIVIDVAGYHTKSSLQEISARLLALEATSATLQAQTAALDAAQPFAVASAPITQVTALATTTVIRQVSVTAPVAGQVALAVGGHMTEGTDAHVVECGIMDSISRPGADEEVLWQAATGANRSNLSIVRAFDIAAGATATYSLVCLNASGGTTAIGAPRLTAIFTPAP